jgi:PmbA protein
MQMKTVQDQQQIETLENMVQDLLDEAKKQGATGAEAGLSQEKGLSVSVRLGEVETIEHHYSQGLGVTVFIGQHKGSASTTDLSPESIRETVTAACSIARYTSGDSFAGLPDKELLATIFPDLKLNDPWDISVDGLIALASESEQAALNYEGISNSQGASVNTIQSLRIFGNSYGFLQHRLSTRHSLSCAVQAEHDNTMQRDYWYTLARNAKNMDSAVEVGQKAATRTLRRLNGRSLSTRQCPVLYSAEIASGLLASFISAISGSLLYRKSSFLLDSVNTRIFPEFVHIFEQPFLPGGFGSSAYDSEGVATKNRDIIKDGILQGYVLSSYSARKLGLQTTGNAGGVHNLTITPGNNNFEALLAQMHTGLVITELLGQGINMVTGDYSRGAAGFWVENGSIQYPVEEITIAGNLKDMFKNIVAVGSDVDYRGNIRTGSILIEQMSCAGDA